MELYVFLHFFLNNYLFYYFFLESNVQYNNFVNNKTAENNYNSFYLLVYYICIIILYVAFIMKEKACKTCHLITKNETSPAWALALLAPTFQVADMNDPRGRDVDDDVVGVRGAVVIRHRQRDGVDPYRHRHRRVHARSDGGPALRPCVGGDRAVQIR